MKFMQFLSRSKIHVPSDVTIFSFVLDAIRYIHLCPVKDQKWVCVIIVKWKTS